MNLRRLQALGIVLGMALFVAAGLTVFIAADRPAAVGEPSAPAVAAATLAGGTVAQPVVGSYADIVEQVVPFVVSVHSERTVRFRQREWSFPFGEDFPFRWFFEGEPAPRQRQAPREFRVPQRGMGSGIIIDRDGHILTNNHVIQNVDEIKVTLADKRSFEATVVGTDPQTDLAVIKIKGPVPRDLPVARIGDSDAARVGDWVLAVGAPFGYEHTVTAGIISAKGRGNIGIVDYEDFIQTDAAINPGNSGGPLVNMRGEVIGINTAIATRVGQYAGVGFAIPINMAGKIMPVLVRGEQVRRGLLGVTIQEIDEDLARQFKLPDAQGALVTQVNPGSAAEKAGLKPGDVIVRFNDRKITDTRHLRNLVAATAPGSSVELLIVREGREQKLTARLGELTPEAVAAAPAPTGAAAAELGLTVEPLTDEKARALGYEGERGVLVSEIEDGSPAALAGIQPGDLITSLNHQPVDSVAAFNEALEKTRERDTVLVLLKRQGASRFVVIKRG
jgi:serine protease Do